MSKRLRLSALLVLAIALVLFLVALPRHPASLRNAPGTAVAMQNQHLQDLERSRQELAQLSPEELAQREIAHQQHLEEIKEMQQRREFIERHPGATWHEFNGSGYYLILVPGR
jgi:uncharacterized protein HemX